MPGWDDDLFPHYTVFCPRCMVCVSRGATKERMLALCDGPFVCGRCPILEQPNNGERFALRFEAMNDQAPGIFDLHKRLLFGLELDRDR